jgi:hypothetical protein
LPVATADTTPMLLTVATAGVLLDHDVVTPEPVRLLVAPAQMVSAPVIEGLALTVTTADLEQPVPMVYRIVVVPGVIPVTVPVALIVPAAVLELLHVPPPVALAKAVVVPIHAFSVPVILVGSA